MNPSSQIIWHHDRGLQLVLSSLHVTRTSAAPFTDIKSVLFAFFALVALLAVLAGVLTKMAAKLYRSVSVLGAQNFEPILCPIKQQRD